MNFSNIITLIFNPLAANIPQDLETSQLIFNANHLTRFYMMGKIGRLWVNNEFKNDLTDAYWDDLFPHNNFSAGTDFDAFHHCISIWIDENASNNRLSKKEISLKAKARRLLNNHWHLIKLSFQQGIFSDDLKAARSSVK